MADHPATGAPAVPGAALLTAGLALGLLGDALLRAPAPPGLNLFAWLASVALAAWLLQRRHGRPMDRDRSAWLAVAVLFAAGLLWRDSTTLKPLAVASVTMAFALAAYRPTAAWVRGAGVTRYLRAWGTGALHAWTASVLVLAEARLATTPRDPGAAAAWRHATAVARGLVIATPLIVVFGALFMSADDVFAELVVDVVRIDVEQIASHVFLFGATAWLATGYLRGFLTGTELPRLRGVWRDDTPPGLVPRRPTLPITEVATALAAVDLLFLLFVVVQFRYLFGGDSIVQITPDLTYAEYARLGFFELVVAIALVVPVLLAADWLLARRHRRDEVVFRILAGMQIALVFVIAASALQRLRLYHASYGLTDSRFYAMVLLLWIGAMLIWMAATVLRGRREAFAFGALASGLATVGLLFAINPDAVVARTNVARAAAGAAAGFDVAYATSLSGDAVPVLVAALPSLPADVQCALARHLLSRWPPDRERPLRSWNWSAARANAIIREHEPRLRGMLGPDQPCPAPAGR